MIKNCAEGPMEEEQTVIEKKKWWLAGIFSFVVPGLGQLYNSEAIKGIVFYLLIFICNFIFLFYLGRFSDNPEILTRPLALYLLLVNCIMVLLYLITIIDAIRSAIKARKGRKIEFYNRWSVYTSILIVFCAHIFLVPNEDIVKMFKIPSGSMKPTVEIGDHLMCDRMYYRSHNPQRGDVIIFQNTKDENKDYLKRIVGLPGDTIELRQNTLFVNGEAVDEPYAVYNGNGNRSWSIPRNYGPYFISENEYFVMGDNRDNSRDSRHFDTVKREKILGKAIFVYFSWDMNISGWNIPARLASIRFSRIGEIL
jgi:signal peptidase I